MSRLPSVGGDDNTWGNVLNDFLMVSHNSDGTPKIQNELVIKAEPGQTDPLLGLQDENGALQAEWIPNGTNGGDLYLWGNAAQDYYADLYAYQNQAALQLGLGASGHPTVLAQVSDSQGGILTISAADSQTDPLLDLKGGSGASFFKVIRDSSSNPDWNGTYTAGSNIAWLISADYTGATTPADEQSLFLNTKHGSGKQTTVWLDSYSDDGYSYASLTFDIGSTRYASFYGDGDGNSNGLWIRAGTGQTNPLLELKDENGSTAFKVNPDGYVELRGAAGAAAFSELAVKTPGHGIVDLYSDLASTYITVKASAAQTDPLLDIKDDSGNTFVSAGLAATGPAGSFSVGPQDGHGFEFYYDPNALNNNYMFLNLGGSSNAIEATRNGGSNKLGFFGAAPHAQFAHPVTLADVIAVLTGLGFTA